MRTDTLDVFRGASYEVAEAIAPTWERRRADIEHVATPVRQWMLEELALQEGDTVLELAAGTGDTGFEAAALVGATGRLISTDFSPSMLDTARRRGAELGVANVSFRVMDAERIELESDSVDAVLCRFGYMLMADPAAALAETRRVLRPGRRLTLAVWGAPERNPFFGIVATSLIRHGHVPPPDPTAPGIFSMASPERTSALLAGAGFSEVRTEHVQSSFPLPSVDEYLAVVADTAGPLGLALRGLSDDDRAAIEIDVETSFIPFRSERGYNLPAVAICAVAV
jgi:SAM-dependent methyltransferase